ncbi:MAG: ATP-binding protein [Proteocatella sp.]
MKQLIVNAKIENLEKIIDFISHELKNYNCPDKIKMQVELAAEEIYSNIIKYAFTDSKESIFEKNITFQLKLSPESLSMIFIDSGKPYNPLESKEPNIELSSENRNIGGLGIFLVKKVMDDIHYSHEDNKNVLTLIKIF